MMKKGIFLAVLVAASVSPNAFAFTGNDLVKWLPDYEAFQDRNSPPEWGAGMFMGYVSGAAEVGNGIVFCAPPGATAQQNAAITAKYLKDHPEEWNKTAAGIVLTALRRVYPSCS